MMNYLKKITLLGLLLIASHYCMAQDAAARIGCKDPNLLVQITELKESLIKQGFEVQNDAMLSMASKQDFPVVVRLQAGVFYQIVFMGNTRSKKMNLDLYGPQQEVLMQKEQQPLNQTSNVISFSYTPNSDGDYTFMLRQTMKQKLLQSPETTCGSFTILRLKKAK